MNATFDTAGNRSGNASFAPLIRSITLACLPQPAVGTDKPCAAVVTGTLLRVRVGRRLAIPAGTPVASVMNGSPANEVG